MLDAARHMGDPLADDVVRKIFESGGIDKVNEIMRTLVRNDQLVPTELPPEVTEYLNTNVLPPTVDMASIQRAEKFFQVWGLQISMSLFCASLPSAYAAANGVKVLFETARLQTDTRRRIMETGQFLMDVMAPGGLAPGGKGVRSAQHIRLMHGAVRQLVAHDGTWDQAAWGLPINQEDLAGTLLSFSYVPVEPMARLGIRVTPDDMADYLYMWSVVGDMLGVRVDLQPLTVADASDLVATIRRRQNRSSPQGAALTAALVTLLEELTPHFGTRRAKSVLSKPHEKGLGRLVPVLIRHLIGDETADLLSVPPSQPGWFRFLAPLLRLLDIIDDAIEHDAHVKQLIEPFSRMLLVEMFAMERGGERAPFAIPDSLAESWTLSK